MVNEGVTERLGEVGSRDVLQGEPAKSVPVRARSSSAARPPA